METVSKKGRPRTETKLYGEEMGKAIMEQNKALFPEKLGRTATNYIYLLKGLQIAETVCDTGKVFKKANGEIKGACILEQIGRMALQNRYDMESCQEITKLSIELMRSSRTVRAIENYIRHGRNTNEW